MTDQPKPDPGNAPPEEWTADLDDAELEAILDRLREDG